MELVYLWVEEYKNIHRQEFNFSSRFYCEFKAEYEKDDKGKETLKENCELVICDKEDLECKNKEECKEFCNESYIKGFFGDNINVTAIVGKNGSGKSSVLKLLYQELIDPNFKGFAIFNNNDKIFFLKSIYNKYSCLDNYQNLFDDNQKIKFPLFDYSYTYEIGSKNNNELQYPKKRINTFNGIIDLRLENIRNQQNILRNYFDLVEKRQLSKFDKFFIPKSITIYFNPLSIKPEKRENIKFKEESENTLNQLNNDIRRGISFNNFCNKLKEVSKLLSNRNSYEEFSNPFDFFKPNFTLGIDELNDNLDIYSKNIWNQQDCTIDLEKLSSLETIQFSDDDDYSLKILSFSIDKLDSKLIDTILASFSSDHFLINLYDKDNKKLSDLSFGEQQLLFILNQIFAFKDLLTTNLLVYDMPNKELSERKIDNFIILLDEIDISFHPSWQKKTIQYILDFLKLIPNINFHLIFTTHSPFLLSDIPKQNIIFLDTYKKNDKEVKSSKQKVGNCKIVDGLNEKKQTFGANIHTLLSNSFFMEEGLMGEFAKGKIDKIIKYLREDKISEPREEWVESKENLKKIIEAIGEPFLRHKVLELYYDKFTDDATKKERKKELEKQKKQIESELSKYD